MNRQATRALRKARRLAAVAVRQSKSLAWNSQRGLAYNLAQNCREIETRLAALMMYLDVSLDDRVEHGASVRLVKRMKKEDRNG